MRDAIKAPIFIYVRFSIEFHISRDVPLHEKKRNNFPQHPKQYLKKGNYEITNPPNPKDSTYLVPWPKQEFSPSNSYPINLIHAFITLNSNSPIYCQIELFNKKPINKPMIWRRDTINSYYYLSNPYKSSNKFNKQNFNLRPCVAKKE